MIVLTNLFIQMERLIDLSSAYNVIKTTKSSAEIIYAKEYNYSDYSVGNSYACRSIGTDAFQWGVFHPGRRRAV